MAEDSGIGCKPFDKPGLMALVKEGRVFPGIWDQAADRLAQASLLQRLPADALGPPTGEEPPYGPRDSIPEVGDFLHARLEDLGLESGADLPLLSPGDLLPEPLPPLMAERMERLYPQRVDLGDCAYRVHYNLGRREVTLELVRGQRKKPPKRAYLPAFRGYRLYVKHRNVIHEVR